MKYYTTNSSLSLIIIIAIAVVTFSRDQRQHASVVTAFAPLSSLSLSLSRSSRSSPSPSQHSSRMVLSMGFFENLKIIFSEEGKANKAAWEKEQREEQEAAMREMLERRRNPEKMEQYEQEVVENRAKLQEEKDVWGFQGKIEEGYDPLTEWNRLKEEGKITVGSQMERDPTTSRLGSEGLVEIRTDELLPYIDQGYVDESADLMGGIRNLFVGGGGGGGDGGGSDDKDNKNMNVDVDVDVDVNVNEDIRKENKKE
mmetsp:Transcript_49205/g.55755  ORF Transcript_49205/g.55755 Transcript_49205/m.55755 type:complete len:256 (-) Transcript_49205:314-1081(-)